MPACSRYDTHQHVAHGCSGSFWRGEGLSQCPMLSLMCILSTFGVGRYPCSSVAHTLTLVGWWSLSGLSHCTFLVNHLAHPLVFWAVRSSLLLSQSPTKINERRLHTCSTRLSISYQAVLYSSAKNVFHVHLPEVWLINKMATDMPKSETVSKPNYPVTAF